MPTPILTTMRQHCAQIWGPENDTFTYSIDVDTTTLGNYIGVIQRENGEYWEEAIWMTGTHRSPGLAWEELQRELEMCVGGVEVKRDGWVMGKKKVERNYPVVERKKKGRGLGCVLM